jgi:threonine synthase
MLYYSTNRKSSAVSIKEAVIRGLAADGGLYLPEYFPTIPSSWFEGIAGKSLKDIACFVAGEFLKDDVPENTIYDIIDASLNFPIPLTEVDENIYSLELYHGPTMAFKDVGARFMSRLMSYLYRNEEKELNVIVATSGDTGSAVASGFFNVPGINVFVLFPKGKVSPLQQKQITTWGGNIHAVQVEGSFDDCQRLAKQILGDPELNSNISLTSANSINIARLIPQSFYYYYAYSQTAGMKRPLVFSVPSGNFGNLTGGLMARATGLPVNQFIAATNVNDVFPKYIDSGKYIPVSSKQTISNAMDVGDPSNFARISDLMGNSLANFRKNIIAFSFTDQMTACAIRDVYNSTGYILDPHGAVAYLGIMHYLQNHNVNVTSVFLETAHPAKFSETMKSIIGSYNDLPVQLRGALNKKEHFREIGNDLLQLRSVISEINL